jgi:hypothetical protein
MIVPFFLFCCPFKTIVVNIVKQKLTTSNLLWGSHKIQVSHEQTTNH